MLSADHLGGLLQNEAGPVEVSDLGLSPELARRLAQWGDRQLENAKEFTGADVKLAVEGLRLAADIQVGVGPQYVVGFKPSQPVQNRPGPQAGNEAHVAYSARIPVQEQQDQVSAEDVSRASCRFCDARARAFVVLAPQDDEEVSGAYLCATCASLTVLGDTTALVGRTDWEEEADHAPVVVERIVTHASRIELPVRADGRRPGQGPASDPRGSKGPEGGWTEALTQWVAADHLTDLHYDHRTESLRATYFDGLPFENEVVIAAREEALAEFLRTEAEHHSWRDVSPGPLSSDLRFEALESLGESLVMTLEEVTDAHNKPRRPIWQWRTGPRGLQPA